MSRRLRHKLDHESTVGITMQDFSFLLALIFLGILLIVLFHISKKVETTNESLDPPGSVIFEITWRPEANTDVDLWVQAPEGEAVGYSNRGNKYLNLLRDDLGSVNDDSGINYEITYMRGTLKGEYTVNVHLYSNNGNAPLPMKVLLIVSLKKDKDSPVKKILTEEVELEFVAEART